MDDDSGPGLRVDRWLWHTRFYKARSQAAAAVRGGHVKVNGERAKPGTRVLPGDRLQIVRDRMAFDVTVRSLPERRGPAPEAKLCYSEDENSVATRQALQERIRQDRRQMLRTEGRPDKHTRRRVRQFNRKAGDD
jgi:ribosome-associated heat shock protein Hsp15